MLHEELRHFARHLHRDGQHVVEHLRDDPRRAPIGATLGTDSKATFSITTTATPRAATSTDVGCAMTRVDSMPIALSLEPQPLSFTGTLSYSFSVTSGSDCTDQLTSSGGTYDALPCAVAYDLTAARTKAP